MSKTLYQVTQHFVDVCIRRRLIVVVLLAIITAVMSYLALQVSFKTDLDDLLPRSHPYEGGRPAASSAKNTKGL